MKRAWLGSALVATLAVAATLTACSSGPPHGPVDFGTPEEYAQELFKESNAQRVHEGFMELEWSDCLATKAHERALNTLPEDKLQHEDLSATCNGNVKAGENLSRGPYAPHDIVDLWMGSPGHRQNILDPEYVISGIACVAMSNEDLTREAQAGEEIGGYACSQLFEGTE